MPVNNLVIDAEVNIGDLSLELVDELSSLEPYGMSNPEAVFAIKNMRLKSFRPLSEGKHISLELEKDDRVLKVVKFSTTLEEFPYREGDYLDLAIKVSKNNYKGTVYLSIQAVDIRLSNIDQDKYFSEKSKYSIFKNTGEKDASLYPTREVFKIVYDYLKKIKVYPYTVDDLYFRLQNQITYGQLLNALKALSQSGLITITDKIILNDTKTKVDLNKTRVMKELNS